MSLSKERLLKKKVLLETETDDHLAPEQQRKGGWEWKLCVLVCFSVCAG